MKFDVAKLDALISQEESAEYWREKAECLEEWVCELLRKNQALRMGLENEQSQRTGHEETSTPSLPSLNQSPFHASRPAFKTELLKSILEEVGSESCPRKECAEIRELVLHYAFMKEFAPEEIN
jgi:hypothetical protein